MKYYNDGWYRVMWNHPYNWGYRGVLEVINNKPTRVFQNSHLDKNIYSLSEGVKFNANSWEKECLQNDKNEFTLIPVSKEEVTFMLVTENIPDYEMPTV